VSCSGAKGSCSSLPITGDNRHATSKERGRERVSAVIYLRVVV
jgi:hypothetical protein